MLWVNFNINLILNFIDRFLLFVLIAKMCLKISAGVEIARTDTSLAMKHWTRFGGVDKPGYQTMPRPVLNYYEMSPLPRLSLARAMSKFLHGWV